MASPPLGSSQAAFSQAAVRAADEDAARAGQPGAAATLQCLDSRHGVERCRERLARREGLDGPAGLEFLPVGRVVLPVSGGAPLRLAPVGGEAGAARPTDATVVTARPRSPSLFMSLYSFPSRSTALRRRNRRVPGTGGVSVTTGIAGADHRSCTTNGRPRGVMCRGDSRELPGALRSLRE